MSPDGIREFEPAVDNGAHQVDTTARTIVFVTGFHIGGAGGCAEPAVNTVQKAIIGDGLPENRKRTGYRRRLVRHGSVPYFMRMIATIGQVRGKLGLRKGRLPERPGGRVAEESRAQNGLQSGCERGHGFRGNRGSNGSGFDHMDTAIAFGCERMEHADSF